MIPAKTFKSALVDFIKADAACAALLGARIYDEAPRDQRGDSSDLAASPWAYLGPIAASRIESDCGPGWLLRLRIYTASTAAGRDEAWSAMDAICNAIEGSELTLSAPAFQAQKTYIILGGDVVDPISPKLVYVDVAAIVAG
jgi:hypothetical protein